MRGRTILIVAVVVAVLGGSAAGVWFLRHQGQHPGRPAAIAAHLRNGPPHRKGVPVSAESTVRLLLSARGRQALTPELSAILPHGRSRLFPAGSKFTPSASLWHQAGAYANVTGILREPGKAPVRAEIGLVDRHGRWLVTFEGGL